MRTMVFNYFLELMRGFIYSQKGADGILLCPIGGIETLEEGQIEVLFYIQKVPCKESGSSTIV